MIFDRIALTLPWRSSRGLLSFRFISLFGMPDIIDPCIMAIPFTPPFLAVKEHYSLIRLL
jgi:hypothetical protein